MIISLLSISPRFGFPYGCINLLVFDPHRVIFQVGQRMFQPVVIVTIGKISQVCATLFTDDYAPMPGLISQTFTGSTFAIVAAKAIIEGLIENGNFGEDGKNQQLHTYFVAGLQKIGEKFPGPIGDANVAAAREAQTRGLFLPVAKRPGEHAL